MTHHRIISTQQLLNEGVGHGEIARLVRSGSLSRVIRGAYVRETAADAPSTHRDLVEALWPRVAGLGVISHWSAACLLGLPVWRSQLDRVAITRTSTGHGDVGHRVHAFGCPLAAAEITRSGSFALTSMERTAIDVARRVTFERGVAVMDAALRLGANPVLMGTQAAEARHRPGIRRAAAAIGFADGRAETVGESTSRVFLNRHGFPRPLLQFEIRSPLGVFIARVDFAWPELKVVGEFDGEVKYMGLLDGRPGAEVLLAEKRREAEIRELGWVVVRWTWDDLKQPERLNRRLQAAFDQAERLGRTG